MAETGAAAPTDPNAPLTGAALADAKKAIAEAIGLADKAIYETAGQLPSLMDRAASGVEDVLTLGVLRETKARVVTSYKWASDNLEAFKKVAWPAANTGLIDGKPMSAKQASAVVAYLGKLVDGAREAIGTVEAYAKGTVIWKSIGSVFGGIMTTLVAIGQAIGKIAAAIAALAGKAADTAKEAIDWLPWIIGGALVLPFVLRTFVAYRKGGAEGAAESAASSIEAGRAAVGRGASRVWEGGKSLVKRAASGGVLKGVPGRRRSRRR